MYGAANCYDCVAHRFDSFTDQTFDMLFLEIICCLKAIQEMKSYLRTGFCYPKGSYSSTILQTCQGLYQGNLGLPAGWFMIICIVILYLEYKLHGVEIKTEITRDNFNILTIIFVKNRDFTTLGKKINSQGGDLIKQHQIIMYDWSVRLRVSGGNMNPEKGFWYFVIWGWTYGKTSMLSSENAVDVHLTRRYDKQVSIEKLNIHQYKK